MIFPAKFNQNLFTKEELDKISNLINIGQYKSITSVLSGDIDQVKEYHLQLLLNSIEPQFSGYEDKVRSNIEQLKRDGIEIENPKQEEAVGLLIAEESKLIKKKNELLNSKRELENVLKGSKEEDADVKTKIREINALIIGLDEDYKKSFSKKEIKDVLLNNAEKDTSEEKVVQKSVDKILEKGEKINSQKEALLKERTELENSLKNKKDDEEIQGKIEKINTELSELEKENSKLFEMPIEKIKEKLDELGVEYDGRAGERKLRELLKNNLK